MQLELLAELGREVAQHARESVEHRTHRDHANRHDRLLKQAGVALQIGQAGRHALVDHRIEFPTGLRQHGLRDDELTDQVDQLIDLLDRDPNGGGLEVGCACGHSRRFGQGCSRCDRGHRHRRIDADRRRSGHGRRSRFDDDLRRTRLSGGLGLVIEEAEVIGLRFKCDRHRRTHRHRRCGHRADVDDRNLVPGNVK